MLEINDLKKTFENGSPALKGVNLKINKGEIHGRPVGITEMNDGAILVTDDVGGKIWRISFSEDN